MQRRFLVTLAAPLAACAMLTQPTSVVPASASNWRTVVTSSDRDRLAGWRTSFTAALADTRKAGHGDDIDAEGALLDPDSALPGPDIANGLYRCRVIKLGAKSAGLLSYVAYQPFTCEVRQSGKVQSFAKLSGSQRPVGAIFAADSLRSVFLGTLVLGDETRALRYGADEDRDIAGYVERIGPARWRLVMPAPHFESKTDVMELVPAG